MKLLHSLMNILDETTEDIIYDPTTLDISKFEFSSGYFKHKLSQREKEKPYMISYVYYGTIVYEHIILLINGVKNIWDLPVETELKIPKLEDLKLFIKNNRK